MDNGCLRQDNECAHSLSDGRHAQISTNFLAQVVAYFGVTGNGGTFFECGIVPQGMFFAFSQFFASVLGEIFQKFPALHMVISSLSKFSPGDVAGLISNISRRVMVKESTSSSLEASWQLTPGTSSIHPIHHSPSLPIVAAYVVFLFMTTLPTLSIPTQRPPTKCARIHHCVAQ